MSIKLTRYKYEVKEIIIDEAMYMVAGYGWGKDLISIKLGIQFFEPKDKYILYLERNKEQTRKEFALIFNICLN